jgi:hypothetical protein
MACKKSELVAAVNSFGAARASCDRTLIAFSGNLLSELIETLEFAPEEEGDFTSERAEQELA